MRQPNSADTQKSSFIDLLIVNNNVPALLEALKNERLARQAEVSALQLKIKQLEQENKELKEENLRLRKSRQGATEAFSKQQNALELKILQLEERLESANKTIAWFKKEYFGRKTEAAESLAIRSNETAPEPGSQQEKSKRGQKSGPGNGHGRSDRSALERKYESADLSCICDICRKPYKALSKTDDSEILEIEVKPYIRVVRKKVLVSRCDCKGKVIVKAPPPPKLYPRTIIGNSLWVYLLIRKYMFSVPLQRILQELSLKGMHLSSGTVIGGMKVIDGLLMILYEQIMDHCRGADFWNGDETSWRVFEENSGARSKKQWWFWLIASMDAIVYLLDRSRSKDVPQNFFAGSAGVLMTDRLGSYKSLNDKILNAWCWVHQRRDLLKILQGIPALQEWVRGWLVEIGWLFALNHQRVKLWQANENWEEAQFAVEQHIKKLEELWQEQLQELDLHSQQKKILKSFRTHWAGLTLFLTDPGIPLENNRAERLLRNLVVNRKNSYGSGKEWSGNLAAKLFTIFQTWQANGLNPEALLLDYFNECSKTPGRPPPDVKDFLPWLMPMERKEKFHLPKNIKRPA